MNRTIRRGMTLLEVLVAVGILSSLIASVVQIRLRAIKQVTETHERNAACLAARNLVAAWEALGVALPLQGNCPEDTGMTYLMKVNEGAIVSGIKCRIWRLMIFRGAPLGDKLLLQVSGLGPMAQEGHR